MQVSPSEVPRDINARYQWLMRVLRARGCSFAAIAREAGVHRQSVIDACFRPSFALECALAAKLGMTVPELFPERYFGGQRIHQIRGENDSRTSPESKLERAGAA